MGSKGHGFRQTYLASTFALCIHKCGLVRSIQLRPSVCHSVEAPKRIIRLLFHYIRCSISIILVSSCQTITTASAMLFPVYHIDRPLDSIHLCHLHLCSAIGLPEACCDYKILSFTYKVLATTQPAYLYNLDPHTGLQVSTWMSYILCHPG